MDPERTAVDESPAPAPVAVLLENHRAFLRYLERRVGDRTLAEDILQDAFAVNSVGLLLMLMPALALMSFVVIPREERYQANAAWSLRPSLSRRPSASNRTSAQRLATGVVGL